MQLKDYVEYHFSCEQKIWEEHFEGDSWVKWHIHAHTEFVSEVIKIKEEDNDRPYDETIELIVKFLTHWLARHILDSDIRMAKVVLALPSGISLARAKEAANEEMAGATKVLIETLMSMYDSLANSTVQMSREIYKRQQAEAEMQRAREIADAANYAKSRFISTMSHELRTPMNAVLGFAQLLEMEDLTEDQLDSVKEISAAGHHLLELINQVLDLSKIESEQLELTLKKVDLNSTIQNCLSLVQPLTTKNQITIINNISKGQHFTVIADSLRFKQVVLNLISNAIKYNRIGGSVSLFCEVINPQRLRIKVVDTGYGLSESQIGNLFQPFERLGAKNSQIEGTGIGLYICKRLVDAMNSRIGVESVEGEGSCFWIETPLAENLSCETMSVC
jgi:signal transduction histidine kinase